MHTHVDFRVAAQSDGTGEIGLYLVDSTGSREFLKYVLLKLLKPDGWQTWDNCFCQNKKFW